jgi:hypothetical protein
MTQTQINNVKHTLNASILLQIALEQLECITAGETPYVRENKMRLNNTIEWLSLQNEAFTSEMEIQEVQMFSEITDEIRKVLNSFSLEMV